MGLIKGAKSVFECIYEQYDLCTHVLMTVVTGSAQYIRLVATYEYFNTFTFYLNSAFTISQKVRPEDAHVTASL